MKASVIAMENADFPNTEEHSAGGVECATLDYHFFFFFSSFLKELCIVDEDQKVRA